MNKILSTAYTKIWTPLFGRILYIFVEQIEGKKSLEKPNYKIDYTNK